MNADDHAPIPVRPDQKVAAVLKEHPELVDTFVAQSDAFKRLQNPLMRKTFARMVTVSQAAAVANIPAWRLLQVLNEAVGRSLTDEQARAAVGNEPEAPAGERPGTPAPASGDPAATQPEWLASAPVAAEIDARDMQVRGEDPFFTIMDAARAIPVGQTLRLRNTFRPTPLLGVLAKKGFVHHAEQLGPEDWSITFLREREVDAEVEADDTHPHGAERPAVTPAAAAAERPTSVAQAAPTAAPTDPEALFTADQPPADQTVAAVVTILPEDLTPPLPMQKVLEGLAPLLPGDLLLVHHMRMPPHLTAKLEQQGHRYRIWDLAPDRKDILIQKADA